MKPTVEIKPQFIEVSTVTDGRLKRSRYIGYTKPEAIKKFKEEISNEKQR
jgi:hypothetical protein